MRYFSLPRGELSFPQLVHSWGDLARAAIQFEGGSGDETMTTPPVSVQGPGRLCSELVLEGGHDAEFGDGQKYVLERGSQEQGTLPCDKQKSP